MTLEDPLARPTIEILLVEEEFAVGISVWSYDHTEIPTANSSSTSNISIVGLASGSSRVIVDWGGFDASPKFSNDGKRIAFVSDGDNPSWGREHYVYTASSSGVRKKKFLLSNPTR